MTVALAELGIRRHPPGSINPRIVEYNNQTNLVGYDDKISWCSSFVNWCMTHAGIRGTGSALARSWLEWGRPLERPVYGCIAILTRDDPANETLLRLEDGQRQWMSWSEWFDMNDVDRQKAQPQDITINSYPQIVQMTILGQGVSLGWRYMIDACIEAGLLVRVTEASASHGGGYYVISPNDRAQNQAARLFTRWLFEQAEKQTAP